MTVEIHFKPEFVEAMSAWFGSFTNPLKLYGVQKYEIEDGYFKTTIFDTRRFRLKDIEKVLIDCKEIDNGLD